jgi:NADH:ubiquinone oxidoreductase subunit 5 (subunit L)/multisubunit Na+/H+ antiporter MnhA subunit
MNLDVAFFALALGMLLPPLALCALTGFTGLCHRPLTERTIARCTQAAVTAGLLAALASLLLMLLSGKRLVPVEFGHWVLIPQVHFHFRLEFVFDRLSVPFAILSFALVGTVGAFARNYLHREAGYGRFFFLYALFLLGMVVASLAGTIETLFLGWELVGLSSALLVAFFHERPMPVKNGLHVWSVYRVADAMFLLATVVLHHAKGGGDFLDLMGHGPWPQGEAALSSHQALLVGLLLLVAAAGKSGLVPFSGWLPRAMEGPTPSSAVFYGALSVHLGTFLLLRVSPILDLSFWLSGIVVAVGLLSAIYGALIARVQTDIKSVLAYASLAQVGVITVEIGLGLRYVALVHIIGHAVLRTLQLLRAPNLLQDYHELENAIGGHLPERRGFWARAVPHRLESRLYRISLDRGYFDALLYRWLVDPFLAVFRWCDRCEQRWTAFLGGAPGRKPPPEIPVAPTEEIV